MQSKQGENQIMQNTFRKYIHVHQRTMDGESEVREFNRCHPEKHSKKDPECQRAKQDH